jgi:hypothetical protein
MKHIICYSGGHSSALVAIEVTRKFGKENVILLNHDINPNVESKDIKRFKQEVADYLGLPITFANIQGITNPEDIPDQFDVCTKSKGFKFHKGTEICTSRLKTEPFKKFLDVHFPDKNCVIYYGFDANEKARIQRRSSILAEMGYRTDFPLALWQERTIRDTTEIGILRPNTYEMFKHGNCFTGDTKFITKGGCSTFVESVGKEVEVITRSGWEKADILHFGKQKIVNLTLTNSGRTRVIKTTENHRWILPKHNHKSFGYVEKPTVDLVKGDKIPSIHCVTKASPDRVGIQHGFTFGDGSLYQTSNYNEGKFKARAYIAEGKDSLKEYFDTPMTVKRNVHGLPAHFKSVPSIDNSEEYLLGFIIGLVASDGCVSKSGISISNKSFKNLCEIQNILNKLGFFSWLKPMKTRSTNYKENASLGTIVIPKICFKKEWLLRDFHKMRLGDKFTEPKSWVVESVEITEEYQDVYCAVVQGDMKEFTLDGGILTGNCVGCLKAGRQHWYIVYCTRKDLWEKAKQAEEDIGYTIIKGVELVELEPMFSKMQELGVQPTEHIHPLTYWASVRKLIKLDFEAEQDSKPCECVM